MEDFTALKVGDMVVVCSGYSGTDYRIAAVERLTATQALVNDARYRRDSGRLVGDNQWGIGRISQYPHLFDKARRQRAERGLRGQFPFTREGVESARAASDYAESVLRRFGQWDAEEKKSDAV